MHSSRLLPLLVVAVAVASLGTARADYLLTCSPSGNYTNDSPYGKNLAELLSTLSTPDPATVTNWWFSSRTVGTGSDQVSGLAMCYAESDKESCLKCLSFVQQYLPPPCSHSRNVSFLDLRGGGCVIRYADAPFFGSADPFGYRSVFLPSIDQRQPQPADVASMREARGQLLSELAVIPGRVALQFATGSRGYVDAVTGTRHVVYGMMQCTRDLSFSECTSCLNGHVAVTYRDERLTNSTEAHVMGFSCYLTYKLDKPIDITGKAPAPSLAPSLKQLTFSCVKLQLPFMCVASAYMQLFGSVIFVYLLLV